MVFGMLKLSTMLKVGYLLGLLRGLGRHYPGCPFSTVITIALHLVSGDRICNRRFCVNCNARSKFTLRI